MCSVGGDSGLSWCPRHVRVCARGMFFSCLNASSIAFPDVSAISHVKASSAAMQLVHVCRGGSFRLERRCPPVTSSSCDDFYPSQSVT